MNLTINAICRWVRRNDGIVQALLMDQPNFVDPKSQQQPVLVNVMRENADFEVGQPYEVTIRSARVEAKAST